MLPSTTRTPRNALGVIDAAQWLALLAGHYSPEHRQEIQRAYDYLQQHSQDTAAEQTPLIQGVEMAALLVDLSAGYDTVVAALLFPLLEQKLVTPVVLQNAFGKEYVEIVSGAVEMHSIQLMRKNKEGQAANEQIDRLRKMLLAMINDVRVVLVKLAERVYIMRFAKHLTSAKQKVLAHEVMSIYAPLANRLGIGQIKWELEDRAFRYLEPKSYLDISHSLDEKRRDREQYIQAMITTLNDGLKANGIKAEVVGRIKHLYSIWRKMQKKDLDFEKLFDVRAMRILVNDVATCYRALSYVHQQWQPVASEFVDYIATPKSNGYRSIHTVVLGPNHKTIEIQIRTHSMHEESEMGVAAHWRYKEGVRHDASYETRIAWLRSLLDWQKELGEGDARVEEVRHKVMNDRIYVLTPEGLVVDLAKGATPVDFAYHVHTEVGHRCRGAKVDGKMVPLTTPLETGQQVSIVTGKEVKPSRDWLRPELNYVHTLRAKQKIQHWFRQQLKEEEVPSEKVEATVVEPEPKIERPELAKPHSHTTRGIMIIQGVDNLMFHMAGCCHPVMGDGVMGYITQGRGVTVHKIGCLTLEMMQKKSPDRLVEVDWGNASGYFPVMFRLVAESSNTHLMRDITQVLSQEKIGLLNLQSNVDKRTGLAYVQLRVEVKNSEQCNHLLVLLRKIAGVQRVDR
jgi:GTP pyrophosphokinase